MCQIATSGCSSPGQKFRGRWGGVAAAILLLATTSLWGQSVSREEAPWAADWRRVGQTVVNGQFPSPATGPAERIWYGPGGETVFVLTRERGIFSAKGDGEEWERAEGAQIPQAESAVVDLSGEPLLSRGGMQFRRAAGSRRIYAFFEQIYRTDDGGKHWYPLTAWRGQSILGGVIRDLAVSPVNADEITAVNDFGVWRSMDGGLSWRGLNEGLPNFPIRRIVGTPEAGSALMAEVEGFGVLAWQPGDRSGWRGAGEGAWLREAAQREALSQAFDANVTAMRAVQNFRYAGAADGRIWVSVDSGVNWRLSRGAAGGAVTAIWADAAAPQTVVAAVAGGAAGRVLRSTNSGAFWDDVSSGLPAAMVWGVTADRESGTLYAATSAGLYYARLDLVNPSPGVAWVNFSGNLPMGSIRDVALGAGGNQLYVAVDGEGVYATLAPHRAWRLRLVNSGDLAASAASPGGLFTLLGAGVTQAWAGEKAAPVLDSTATEAQIQIPYDVNGDSLALALEGPRGRTTFGLPLRSVSPSVVVDTQGVPLLLDGDSGLLLDGGNPARSSRRVQVLMTGLGKVNPEWVAGLAAPLEAPPKVMARIAVYLDRQPAEVTRATLAPGYVGFYLIEFVAPAIVNAGPAEFYVEVDGQRSNPVRVYLAP